MALQGSGQIKLSEIATEFGGSAPHRLSEYYGAASGVPSSGEIQLAADFYGTSSCTSYTTSQFRTMGSAIGNMTRESGIASAFNNSTSGDYSQGARLDPSYGAYIGRNFGQAVNIGQIKIWNPSGGGGSNVLPGDGFSDGGGAYYAQHSSNGSSWTTIASGTNPASDILTITFTGTAKQYWRVYWTGDDNGGTVQEMEFTSGC